MGKHIPNLAKVIRSLHPDLKNLDHYQLDNSGGDLHISAWEPPDGRAEPTLQELDEAAATFDENAFDLAEEKQLHGKAIDDVKQDRDRLSLFIVAAIRTFAKRANEPAGLTVTPDQLVNRFKQELDDLIDEAP